MTARILVLLVLASALAHAEEPAASAPQVTLGNGEANWIHVDGATRDGATLTFPEVHIEKNGWLVLHPFEGGKPNGKVYVGATYVGSGTNSDVAVRVEGDSPPQTGDMFIVMLHNDVNENREFDFVFVDERNVLDKAVFEGTIMIAHAISAP